MKQLFKSASLAAFALGLSACGLSPDERIDRAEAAYAENRFTEARLDLASALQEDVDNIEALELMARTQLQIGDGEGAAFSLARLDDLRARPGDFEILMAEALLLRGEFAEAISRAEALGSAEGMRIAALSHIGIGNVRSAQSAFEEGMEKPGDQSRLLADYAIFMLNAGDAQAADLLATRARAANGIGLDPLIASARVAQARGDLNRALEYYSAAAEEWPEARIAILGRIGVLGDLGRINEVRPLINEMAERLPGDADILYLQARLAAEESNWAKVRDILQPIERRDIVTQQLLYARALVELDLPEQALPRLQTLLRRSPASPAIRRLLARAQFDAGNADAAYNTIRPLAISATGTAQDLALFANAARATGRSGDIGTALASAPPSERIGTLLAEGDRALRNENWRTAIDAYEELRAWTGNSNALVLNNLAYAHGRAGNPEEAIRLGELAHELAPEHASIMDTLGWLLVSTGNDRSRGLLLLERAAELDPTNATINRHLAEARGA